MPRIRTLMLVLAGGAGSRLDLLTQDRAKPAVSFGGTHRLIDFPLSNARNSGIDDVWVSQQFNPISLELHLANGRPWDMDRTTGGLLLLHPREGHDDRTGFVKGTADGLWRFAPLIRDWRPAALVVVSADAVYKCDYGELVEEHVAQGTDLTLVTKEVDPEDAGRYGVVQVDQGMVTGYELKPDEPEGNLVSNEIFVMRPEPVLDVLEELAEQEKRGEGEGDDSGWLEDLGSELLPRLVADGKVREHRMRGYWRDVGTVESYWESHQDLLGAEPAIDLDDPMWPVLTRATSQRASAHVLGSARVQDSLLAPGSRTGGRVERSVIGRGAVVEKGAVVIDSVLLPGAVVRAGAHVERAILDEKVTIGRDAVVGKKGGDIALVGLGCEVEPGAKLKAGARFPEVEEG